MEWISWIERKTNKEVFLTVKVKRTLKDVIRARRWKMVGHSLRHPEELEGMIERKKITGCPLNSYINEIKSGASQNF